MQSLVARPNKSTRPVHLVARSDLRAFRKQQPPRARRWLETVGSTSAGSVVVVPAEDGGVESVVAVVDDRSEPWAYAALPAAIPPGRYQLAAELAPAEASAAALGWALASYSFDRYRKPSSGKPRELVWPEGAERRRVHAEYEGICLARDLINTPASDLGPDELAAAVKDLGKQHGARVKVLRGDALLKAGYPTIHAVGRASSRPPVLAELSTGPARAPRLSLVGKGVVFDTGGLDIKNASGMRLMKKDMGGAATVLGLTHVLLSLGLKARLRVLIPAVENAVSGDAYRPQDVLKTRSGKTVEVGNTDAEGRLIMSDALFEAASEEPDLIVDFATLTGAARIALGTALPALFTNDDELAEGVLTHGVALHDPLWRMPIHEPYRRKLDSPIADLSNIGSDSYGGAITAALFLREFVGSGLWAHVDTMGWNVETLPGRPLGGEAMGLRAMAAALLDRYGKAR